MKAQMQAAKDAMINWLSNENELAKAFQYILRVYGRGYVVEILFEGLCKLFWDDLNRKSIHMKKSLLADTQKCKNKYL